MSRLFISILLFCTFRLHGQSAIDLPESTVKIPAFGEEVFYFGFAVDDQIVFNVSEIHGKSQKEVEVMEWPTSVKFSDFKINKLENKVLKVPRTAVYRFRLTSAAIASRVCRIRIQRVPANNTTLKFDSKVYWRVVNDTTCRLVTERHLAKSDTSILDIAEQVTKVSSRSAFNGNPNIALVDFDLPEGTLAWSYYIGVGTEGRAAYNSARDNFLSTTVKQASKIEGYGTMAALAIYGLNFFAREQGGNNTKYWMIPDWNNVQLFRSRQRSSASNKEM